MIKKFSNKLPALLLAILLPQLESVASVGLENFCPHFSTNTQIIWNAPTNELPQSFWIYKRLPPQPFSEAVISNAIVLASLQKKGFPKPSTSDFFIPADHPPNWPGTIRIIFSITPKSSTISYSRAHPDTNTTDIPADTILAERAWDCARQLGVDVSQVVQMKPTSYFNKNEKFEDLTNQLCGRGVFLARKLDGILFTDIGDEGGNDGFWIELGSRGQIRAFSLVWPRLERSENQPTANPQQIVACIRAFKAMTLPIGQETNYFARLKNLSMATKLTITGITPFYWELIYGDAITNDEPSKIISPFAKMNAVAEFGTNNTMLTLLSPITVPAIARLMKKH